MAKKISLSEIIGKPMKDRPKVVRTKWRFWPTEASCVDQDGKVRGRCLRQSAYQWLSYDVSNPVNDFVKQCGDMGNYLELKTINEFKQKGIFPEHLNKKSVRKQQVIMFDDAQLSGEVDIFIAGGTQEAGVEVKSYVNSTYKVQAAPKDPHLLQAFLYLCMFEPKQPYFIIYYRPSPLSKWATEDVQHRIDTVVLEGKTYPVIKGKIDRGITLEGIIQRYKELKEWVEKKELPPREFKKSDKACEYCNYKTTCWSK